MSNQFYDYLSKKIVNYLESIKINDGDRFYIQFEQEDQVERLYYELKQNQSVKEFKCLVEKSTYTTYCLSINSIRVIVASTVNNTKADFLTTLRNKLNSNDEQFSDTAILFIHNSTLDSIVKGAISFHREGMPFHMTSLITDIENKINISSLSEVDKSIILFDLGRRRKELFEDNSSLFQYEDILTVLNSDGISRGQYRNFGLFFDPELSQYSGSTALKRIDDNYKLFLKVDTIHKFGNPDVDLEKHFDDEGVEELKRPTWKEAEYRNIKLSQEDRNKKVTLDLLDVNCSEELVIWQKLEGETQAKSRIKNIIIFNNEKLNTVTLEFSFSEHLRQVNLECDNKQEAKASTTGKKLKVEINHELNNASFSIIKYQDKALSNSKYVFKILVIDFEEEVFKNFKTNYNIFIKGKERYLLINSEEDIIINPSGIEEVSVKLSEDNKSFTIPEENLKVIIHNDTQPEEDSDFIKFDIYYLGIQVPCAIRQVSQIPRLITGFNIWRLKREIRDDFRVAGDNKLIQGTNEYFTKDEYRKNLEKEKFIIDTNGLSFTELNNELNIEDLELHPDLQTSYIELVQYYKVNNLIPSLAFFNDELITLSNRYVNKYLEVISSIQENSYINSDSQRNLSKVGTIKKLDGDRELILTPLHPINVAYQLILNQKLGNEIVREELLQKLSPINLLPYLCSDEGRLYKPVEQTHSPEWIYFVDHKNYRYKGSRNFVSKLVREKIEEFIDHFSYLFNISKSSPIKLNLINLGDCREILQGIFAYYIKCLNKGERRDELIPIDIHIYGMINSSNDFEKISFYNSPKLVNEAFQIDLNSNDYSEEDVLNVFREKVSFYASPKEANSYEYCHIAFYEMDQFIEEKESSMTDINTGMSLSGLLSGIPSMFLGDSYRTGFGTKHINNTSESFLLELACKINSLVTVIKTGAPYHKTLCMTTTISEKNKKLLDKVYESSHWITFIDPKVDLNFFKNDITNKDLIIIHYNDQYTSSSGYDAITVTRRSKQYKNIIEEFLKGKGIDSEPEHSSKLINCFNAINGDWLLSLISSKSQFPREKLSIISAIKICLAYFSNKNIIWVPISLEEILRVSGGAGLNKSDGLFSVRNLGGAGVFSDDLMLIGIEYYNGELKMHYYPIEVKIGKNKADTISKAIEQAKNTRKLFEENLIEIAEEGRAWTKRIYRNFLAQLVIISAEKMKLYNIWDEQNWDIILDTEVRTKLLNDEYEVSNILDEYIGRGAVISFKEGNFFNDPPVIEDNVYVLNFSEESGYNNIVSDIEVLKNKYISNKSDFKKDTLLYYSYKPENSINIGGQADTLEKEDYETRNVGIDKGNGKIDRVPLVSEKPLEIIFGSNTSTSEVVKWYPTDTTKTDHTNTGIIGTMGTGKTQFTKSVITQLTKRYKSNVNGTKVGVLIFDYKGDYIKQEFTEVTNAKVYDLYHLPYNPLSLFLTDTTKNLLPLHTANSLKETISKAFNLGIKQETLLKDIIMETYEKRGISKNDSTTWSKLAPTIYDVYQNYVSREDLKEDSLYAAFTNLVDFEIFEPDSSKTKALFDIIDGVTVINLSGMDEGIQNLVVAITLDIFYSQMQMAGHSINNGNYREMTKIVLVDEADNFLSKDFKSIKKILKEGREFGVGTILSTQFLSHFSTADNEYANYIGTWVVHKVPDMTGKDVKFIFNTQSKSEEDNVINRIKKLEKHHSIVALSNESKPLHIRDKAFWELKD